MASKRRVQGAVKSLKMPQVQAFEHGTDPEKAAPIIVRQLAAHAKKFEAAAASPS